MVGLLKRTLRFIDRHPTLFILGFVGGGALLSYAAFVVVADGPVMLEPLSPEARRDVYGSLAATSGVLLGFVISSLSILFALPSSDAVARLRTFRAWRVLNQTLLVTAALLGATLALSTVALGVDGREHGCVWLEGAVAIVAFTAFVELVAGGIAFALVVLGSGDR